MFLVWGVSSPTRRVYPKHLVPFNEKTHQYAIIQPHPLTFIQFGVVFISLSYAVHPKRPPKIYVRAPLPCP